eukprot:Platyproteum_vivax@DN3903_c0_g2_i1.p1
MCHNIKERSFAHKTASKTAKSSEVDNAIFTQTTAYELRTFSIKFKCVIKDLANMGTLVGEGIQMDRLFKPFRNNDLIMKVQLMGPTTLNHVVKLMVVQRSTQYLNPILG